MNSARFYKEHLENESETYIHHRAYIEGKTPLQTPSEIKEAILAGENVIDILTRSVMRQLSRRGNSGSTDTRASHCFT